jgi:hypothetical protein
MAMNRAARGWAWRSCPLRKTIRGVAGIDASKEGFVLVPHRIDDVAVFAPPTDDDDAAVLALLPDGEARSRSSLALALGASQRTVLRAPDGLAASNKVRSVCRACTRRWMTSPLPGFRTSLLLTTAQPAG